MIAITRIDAVLMGLGLFGIVAIVVAVVVLVAGAVLFARAYEGIRR